MKVGFDISQLAHLGGVATYTDNLSRELSKLTTLDMVFFYSSLRRRYKGSLKGVKTFRIPPTVFEILFNIFHKVEIEKFIGSVDIFHSSDWVQPLSRAKKVTTYHDVIPLKYPEWSTPKVVDVHKRRLKLVEEEIDMVIAVSESTKKDLLEISKISEDKVVVIYEGVEKDFKVIEENLKDLFRKKYNLSNNFVMAIGGVGSRRNLEKVKVACKGYQLVIPGETIPYLSRDELVLLYNCASLLLYPSLYEGFGLPVLEAMACGTPVVTSNSSSLPEVGGEAAFYVDPKSQIEITDAVSKIMEDSDLRDKMRKKGLVQASKFSWEICAQKTYEVYKRVLQR